jgi:hypothetical protein
LAFQTPVLAVDPNLEYRSAEYSQTTKARGFKFHKAPDARHRTAHGAGMIGGRIGRPIPRGDQALKEAFIWRGELGRWLFQKEREESALRSTVEADRARFLILKLRPRKWRAFEQCRRRFA